VPWVIDSRRSESVVRAVVPAEGMSGTIARDVAGKSVMKELSHEQGQAVRGILPPAVSLHAACLSIHQKSRSEPECGAPLSVSMDQTHVMKQTKINHSPLRLRFRK
jgi:hypothetical protein